MPFLAPNQGACILVLKQQCLTQSVDADVFTLTILLWRLIVTPSAYHDILPQVPQYAIMSSLPGYDVLLKSI